MTKTKEQMADKLLCAAKHWQNGNSRAFCDCETEEIDDFWMGTKDTSASGALSEAAGLGFDIVDAETE